MGRVELRPRVLSRAGICSTRLVTIPSRDVDARAPAVGAPASAPAAGCDIGSR
jgi:hypothetical protein